MEPALPRKPADVSIEWISHALDCDVASLSVRTIAEGAGFMGKLAVATVTYPPGTRGPTSVVVKMPTDDPGVVALGQMLRLWEKEARFYLDLAPDLPVRTPHCYWAGGDPATGVYGLVLEDLSHLTNGDQLAGATPAQAAAAIDALANWQASESGDGPSSRLEWLPSTSSDPMYLGLQPLLDAVWPPFVDQLGDRAPPGTLGVIEASIPALTENFQRRLLEPTLVHSDFRVDNLFFDDDGVIVLDWQAVATGQGLYDLTYFLAGSISTEHRRAEEGSLVDRYRRGLAEGGISVPPSGEFFALYRRSMLSTSGIACMLLGQLDFTVNQRAADLARGMAARFLTAAADLDVAEFVSA
jgi:hypothetical protein